MDYLVGSLVMLGVPVYVVLQALTAVFYRGRWRLLALVPLLVMVPLALHAAYALSAGSNLWPLLVILASPLACAYLLVVALVRHSQRATSPPSAPA